MEGDQNTPVRGARTPITVVAARLEGKRDIWCIIQELECGRDIGSTTGEEHTCRDVVRVGCVVVSRGGFLVSSSELPIVGRIVEGDSRGYLLMKLVTYGLGVTDSVAVVRVPLLSMAYGKENAE